MFFTANIAKTGANVTQFVVTQHRGHTCEPAPAHQRKRIRATARGAAAKKRKSTTGTLPSAKALAARCTDGGYDRVLIKNTDKEIDKFIQDKYGLSLRRGQAGRLRKVLKEQTDAIQQDDWHKLQGGCDKVHPVPFFNNHKSFTHTPQPFSTRSLILLPASSSNGNKLPMTTVWMKTPKPALQQLTRTRVTVVFHPHPLHPTI
jgi:hypothetical protein